MEPTATNLASVLPPAPQRTLQSIGAQTEECFDARTNFVYISDKLETEYPGTHKRLTQLFDELQIDWGEIEGTKDIWLRDFMPIQLKNNAFLTYKYAPNYLKEDRYLTDSHAIGKRVLDECFGKDCKRVDTGLTLDGGNFVECGTYWLLTVKAISDNDHRGEQLRKFVELAHGRAVFLPWVSDEPNGTNADIYGHADGLVQWCGRKEALMSNYHDFHPQEAADIKNILERLGFHVTEMLFDVKHPNREYNWAYVNYLRVGRKIIVPTFGIEEDNQALDYIRKANPQCEVRGFRLRCIANNGGALHCIT